MVEPSHPLGGHIIFTWRQRWAGNHLNPRWQGLLGLPPRPAVSLLWIISSCSNPSSLLFTMSIGILAAGCCTSWCPLVEWRENFDGPMGVAFLTVSAIRDHFWPFVWLSLSWVTFLGDPTEAICGWMWIVPGFWVTQAVPGSPKGWGDHYLMSHLQTLDSELYT